ncbi:hypothetical protein ACLB2K_026338 [Fragaria x ananassa]
MKARRGEMASRSRLREEVRRGVRMHVDVYGLTLQPKRGFRSPAAVGGGDIGEGDVGRGRVAMTKKGDSVLVVLAEQRRRRNNHTDREWRRRSRSDKEQRRRSSTSFFVVPLLCDFVKVGFLFD